MTLSTNDIHAVSQFVQQHINERWETTFQQTEGEMRERYPEIGDGVYGIYGTYLFHHIHDQFKQAGLRSTPRLPFGGFSTSREWGSEDDRQRWFWSKITSADGIALGTIVVAFFHDHEAIRIPRPPQILALEATTKTAVIKALSSRSADFKNAPEAKVEYAQYMNQA